MYFKAFALTGRIADCLYTQGNALGINVIQLTPCKGKSFTYRRGFSFFYLVYFKAFALTGRIADCLYTQGVALGYELLPFTFPFGRWPLVQGVLLWASWPSGRCCLYGLLPFTFALPFGQRFSIPLRAGDRWFRAWCFNFSKIISASVIVCTNICAKITL